MLWRHQTLLGMEEGVRPDSDLAVPFVSVYPSIHYSSSQLEGKP